MFILPELTLWGIVKCGAGIVPACERVCVTGRKVHVVGYMMLLGV